MARPFPALTSAPWSAELAVALEVAAMAVARLDARISATSVASAWNLRATWAGYGAALQLQGVELDEIDVFSWGTGIPLPGRQARPSLDDPFQAFEPWRRTLSADDHHWREQLPFTPDFDDNFTAAPLMVRALEIMRQFALADRSIQPWLSLPVLLQRMGATQLPLPSLVCGDKAARFGSLPPAQLITRQLKAIAKAANRSLDALQAIEEDRRKAIAIVSTQHRPGELATLAARLLHHPATSPERAAEALGMTLSGAGKLLDRAANLGLVREVSGRRSWRVYVVPDVAVALGLVAAPRGRPRKPPPPAGSPRAIDDILSAFDRDMAEFDARFGSAGQLGYEAPL